MFVTAPSIVSPQFGMAVRKQKPGEEANRSNGERTFSDGSTTYIVNNEGGSKDAQRLETAQTTLYDANQGKGDKVKAQKELDALKADFAKKAT
jgi:hypothetical protein